MKHIFILFAAATAIAQSISISGAPATGHAARATQPITLVATGATAPVRWIQVSGEPLYFSAPTATTTSVTPPAAGTYSARIVATNGTADLQFGAVAAASSGAVKWADPNIAKMYGPAMRLGGSPYTEFHRDLANKIWTKFQLPDWNGADWKTQLTGTVSVANGSNVITGASGTTFLTHFCAAGVGSFSANWIVIWHDGGAGRRLQRMATCASDSSGTLDGNWTGTSGTYSYSRVLCPGCWTGGSDNLNYYDVVSAFYRLYYRTGDTLWRDRARVLADNWNEGPGWDEGRIVYFGSPGPLRAPPRTMALLGLMWWAYESGNSAWWSNNTGALDSIKADVDTEVGGANNLIGDIREQMYRLAFLAVASVWHPDSAKRSAYLASVQSSITSQWAARGSGGVPPISLYYGTAPWNGGAAAGTVTVTTGSAVVTGAGTNFTAGNSFGNQQTPTGRPSFWVATASNGLTGDARAYTVQTFTSSTSITLSEPYAGPGCEAGCSGRYWQMNTITGRAWQPFQLGLGAAMWRVIHQFTGIEAARQFAIDWAGYVTSQGWQSSTRGLRFAVGGPDCAAPAVEGSSNCLFKSAVDNPFGIWDARMLNTEATQGCAAAIEYGASALLSACDDLYSAAYSCSAGMPSYDTKCAQQLVESVAGSDPTPKTVGFAYGVGGGSSYPAARVGGYVADPRSIVVAAGSGVTVDVRYPDGQVIATTCTAGACTANYDAAQGTPKVRITRGGIVGGWR